MREDSHAWQKVLASGFSTPADLLKYLELPESFISSQAERLFKTRVPIGYANLIEKGNAKDPLLRQVLSSNEETQSSSNYVKDPLEENTYNTQKGLIQKYPGRVLLLLTGACAINCRYCFRRHFPYSKNIVSHDEWADALKYIENDHSIKEVILSGGDPLLVGDNALKGLLSDLSEIRHVNTVRFHTRIPVVLPERIDASFLSMLKTTSLQIVFVLHANHPNELGERVLKACQNLRSVGSTVLNQSVLLKGVNDAAEILQKLSEKLFECGVLPYYLHTLDKVEGAQHFDVPLGRAKLIHKELQSRLPGYLVPKLVTEKPGYRHKIQLSPS